MVKFSKAQNLNFQSHANTGAFHNMQRCISLHALTKNSIRINFRTCPLKSHLVMSILIMVYFFAFFLCVCQKSWGKKKKEGQGRILDIIYFLLSNIIQKGRKKNLHLLWWSDGGRFFFSEGSEKRLIKPSQERRRCVGLNNKGQRENVIPVAFSIYTIYIPLPVT